MTRSKEPGGWRAVSRSAARPGIPPGRRGPRGRPGHCLPGKVAVDCSRRHAGLGRHVAHGQRRVALRWSVVCGSPGRSRFQGGQRTGGVCGRHREPRLVNRCLLIVNDVCDACQGVVIQSSSRRLLCRVGRPTRPASPGGHPATRPVAQPGGRGVRDARVDRLVQ